MKHIITKTTNLTTGWQSEINLIETANGDRWVRKNYSESVNKTNPTLTTEEWDTLVYLHKKGFSVPKPIKKDTDGIHMQYIENGALWDIYTNSNDNTKQKLMQKYVKLLNDLHAININDIKKSYEGKFVQNELAEIRNIIEKNSLTDYIRTLEKLETESAKIKEQPLCFIHRDYHPWNVVADKNGKLYVIDIFFTLGDYRFDVAWAYMHMLRDDNQPEFINFANNFLSEYLKNEPDIEQHIEDFEFFKQLANLRWLVNVRPGEWSEKSDFWKQIIKKAESIMTPQASPRPIHIED